MSRERAASDAVYKVFEAWVSSDGFRWGGLENELARLDEQLLLLHTFEKPKALKKGVTRTRPI